MSATDFLPRRESNLVTWTRNFTARLVSDPVGFGIPPAMAAQYMAVNDAFLEAYIIANRKSTRTGLAVLEKNEAMATLRAEARKLSRIIKANDAITNTQRKVLGLSLRDGGGRSPRIPRPAEPPRVIVEGKVNNVMTIRVCGPHGTKRSKPEGVAGARLYTFVGEEPPESGADFTFRGTTTRTRTTISFPAALPAGTKVWIAACWYNPRGETGPICTPISAYTDYAVALKSEGIAHQEVAEQYRKAA